MLSMLMTTEYAPPEDRHELQQLLICIAGSRLLSVSSVA